MRTLLSQSAHKVLNGRVVYTVSCDTKNVLLTWSNSIQVIVNVYYLLCSWNQFFTHLYTIPRRKNEISGTNNLRNVINDRPWKKGVPVSANKLRYANYAYSVGCLFLEFKVDIQTSKNLSITECRLHRIAGSRTVRTHETSASEFSWVCLDLLSDNHNNGRIASFLTRSWVSLTTPVKLGS